MLTEVEGVVETQVLVSKVPYGFCIWFESVDCFLQETTTKSMNKTAVFSGLKLAPVKIFDLRIGLASELHACL